MASLGETFAALRPLFAKHEAHCLLVHDGPDRYFLATHEVRARDGYRTALGGVEIKKNYVSAHLLPVYVHPEPLADASTKLRTRMQGKSCFNFRTVDPPLFEELGTLIGAGVESFRRDGRL